MPHPVFRKLERHQKGWGEELWIINCDKYCGKVLRFNKGSSFSMHYHLQKEETWCVFNGELTLEFFNLDTAERQSVSLHAGDVVHMPQGTPHKLTAVQDSVIVEVSSQHFEEDSFRFEKGDSQK